MKITSALIIRLAKLPAKDQHQVMTDNPDANYALMIEKCNDLSEQMKDKDNGELSEKIENVKFLAGVYQQRQKHGAGAVIIETA